MNSQLFEQWFENCLLSEFPYGSIIEMDNAAFHRKKQINLIAQNKGHRIIFLPPILPRIKSYRIFLELLKTKA